jgi:hypothetical protein
MKKIFKNKIIITLLFGAIIFGGFWANSVLAAGLVPCGDGNDPANRCTLCHLILGFQSVIDYGFNILVFVALAMLLGAGILYIFSTGDQGLIGTAKSMMKNTLFGFAFVLLAWLFVNTTILILGANVGIGKTGVTWNSFTCDATRSPMK